MKNLILSLMIVSSFSCQTTSPSTLEREAITQPVSEAADEDYAPIPHSTNPGMATFKIEILENHTAGKEICGVSKKNVFSIRVLEIIEKGMGISHMPRNKDDILVNFIIANDDLLVGAKIEAKAKESLCRDASKNYFTIISYKVLE